MSRVSDQSLAPHEAEAPDKPPKIRDLLATSEGSAFARYRRLTCTGSLTRFWLSEFATMLLMPLPGGLGIILRQKLLKRFFGAMGRNVIIGRNCVFRHPLQIFLGDGVVIDENCLLDARGAGEQGLHLAEGALISRNVQIKSKGGPIQIGRDVNIGDNSLIVSQTGIHIGDGAAVASGCQIMGGTFAMEQFNKPAPERISTSAGPIDIAAGSWLATGVTVLDGARVGEHSIVSAGSVVTHSLPARCVAQGNPARQVFSIR